MFFCKNNRALSLTLRAHIVVGSLAVVQRLIHDDVPTCHLRDGSHFVRHEDNGAVAGIIGDNIIEMRLKTLVDVAASKLRSASWASFPRLIRSA